MKSVKSYYERAKILLYLLVLSMIAHFIFLLLTGLYQ